MCVCVFACSHGNQDGLTGARKLCESLIQTVQKDYDTWKANQQPLGFGGQAPQCKITYILYVHCIYIRLTLPSNQSFYRLILGFGMGVADCEVGK